MESEWKSKCVYFQGKVAQEDAQKVKELGDSLGARDYAICVGERDGGHYAIGALETATDEDPVPIIDRLLEDCLVLCFDVSKGVIDTVATWELGAAPLKFVVEGQGELSEKRTPPRPHKPPLADSLYVGAVGLPSSIASALSSAMLRTLGQVRRVGRDSVVNVLGRDGRWKHKLKLVEGALARYGLSFDGEPLAEGEEGEGDDETDGRKRNRTLVVLANGAGVAYLAGDLTRQGGRLCLRRTVRVFFDYRQSTLSMVLQDPYATISEAKHMVGRRMLAGPRPVCKLEPLPYPVNVSALDYYTVELPDDWGTNDPRWRDGPPKEWEDLDG
jgi:hypothetical protein